jgi:AhpD family alkylhydroperoxidase
MQMRALVVYYSRGSTTELVARAIAKALCADIDAIVDRIGPKGGLAGVRTSVGSPEASSTREVGDYDLLIVGSPVFGATPANPIHSFLIQSRADARAIAFFCTGTGVGHARALGRMARIARRNAVATLSLTRDDVADGRMDSLIESFVNDIQMNLPSANKEETRMGTIEKTARTQVHHEITDSFGRVPDWTKQVPDPALVAVWQMFRDFYLADTTIPPKYKELIGLAVSGATRCRYSTLFHTERARLYGATDQEIGEAAMLAGVTMMASTFLNGQQVDYIMFKKETQEIVAWVREQESAGKLREVARV